MTGRYLLGERQCQKTGKMVHCGNRGSVDPRIEPDGRSRTGTDRKHMMTDLIEAGGRWSHRRATALANFLAVDVHNDDIAELASRAPH